MDDLLQLFQDGATYLINGGLRVIYALGDHGPHLSGLLCALIMAGLLDRWTVALVTTVSARSYTRTWSIRCIWGKTVVSSGLPGHCPPTAVLRIR